MFTLFFIFFYKKSLDIQVKKLKDYEGKKERMKKKRVR